MGTHSQFRHQTKQIATKLNFLEEKSIEFKMPKGGLSGVTKPYALSPALTAIVGKKEASRAEVTKLLWAYLKQKNLQDPENRQYFTPDDKMAKIFGTDKIRGFGMAKYLTAHLTPLDK